MIDPPKRLGCRLTYDAECLYNDWQEIGGCSCHTGCAPCSSCCAEGHPISLEENDEAWEPNYTIEDVYNAWKLKQEKESMSRTEIKDKGGTQPRSEWFSFKYRVTPETSKLLQEAVFKDGGGWGYSRGKNVAHTDQPFLIVRYGEMTYSNDEHYFETCVYLPEKQPPQATKVEPAKKDFVVGKYYKYTLKGLGVFKTGNYYKLFKVSGGLLFSEDMYNYVRREAFDIDSESDYDPNTAHGKFVEDLKAAFPPFDKVVDTDVKECRIYTSETYYDSTGKWVVPKEFAGCVLSSTVVNFKQNDFLTTKEGIDMSNQNRVVSVKFFDDDAGLKAENSLVAEYQITTRVSDQMTISKVLLTGDVAGDIALHNGIRANTVDLHILKQTGNKVFLQPIDFEDLRVEVRQV